VNVKGGRVVDDGLVTCPVCEQRTTADAGECQWCDEALGAVQDEATKRIDSRSRASLDGCLVGFGVTVIGVLAVLAVLFAYFGILVACEGQDPGLPGHCETDGNPVRLIGFLVVIGAMVALAALAIRLWIPPSRASGSEQVGTATRPSPQPSGRYLCRECGSRVVGDEACRSCGTRSGQDNWQCGQCDAAVAGDRKCWRCGEPRPGT